ncbi:DUF3179 domain-containing protein [Candidatus Peregrinibacteria bacterium]|nr:DUF3179 domain-containing protein [Candidatus Peregrinibacteria bacterium]
MKFKGLFALILVAFIIGAGGYYIYNGGFFENGYRLTMNDVQDLADRETNESNNMVEQKESELIARLERGCIAGKDCIPSIDDPKFVSAAEADEYLDDDDWVIGLERSGVVRAYPLNILNWHEIINDKVGDEPIAISFCPLCYTGNAFIREIDGEETEFGVSGYLINSNLVMYDRLTGSLWEQLTGEALNGPNVSEKLKKITVATLPWEDWLENHPETQVLSRDTGFDRDYDQSPYGDYDESTDVFFSVANRDNRLFEKEIVYGVYYDGVAKAYPRSLLENLNDDEKILDDEIGDNPVEIKWDDGKFSVFAKESGEEIVPEISFWFAWVAFYPDTEIYERAGQ